MAANNGLINITASVLPDDMRTHVSGDIEYDLNDGAGDDCKWISYAQDIDTSSEALIVADIGYLQGVIGDTTPTRTAAADSIEFIVIKHSGFQADGTTVSTDNMYFNFTNSVAADGTDGDFTLEPGDVWWGRPSSSTPASDFTAIAAANDIKVLVYAVLDDA